MLHVVNFLPQAWENATPTSIKHSFLHHVRICASSAESEPKEQDDEGKEEELVDVEPIPNI